jgi:hypothetical protein
LIKRHINFYKLKDVIFTNLGNQYITVNYLCFDFVGLMNLGEQLSLCFKGIFSEVTQQIEFVRTFAAQELGQLVRLGHLKKKLKP